MGSKKINKKRFLIITLAELTVLAVLVILLVMPRESKDTGKTPTGTAGITNAPTKTEQVSGIPATPTPTEEPTAVPEPTDTPTPTMTEEEVMAQQQAAEQQLREEKAAVVIEKADRLAAMYDYDTAIATVAAIEQYETLENAAAAIVRYEQAKAACVVWKDNTKISHCFFHSLIVDTSLAFGPDSGTVDGYNRYMTTIPEFEKILESLYEKGYVLINIHDMAEIVVQEDGTQVMTMKKIYLPEGKIPIVMSQDDVNYYDYMDDEGFANKIIVGEDGKATCEYINQDGTVVYGDYDLVPILDKFVEKHPDFSYHGAKAMLCITGFEGTLGYETAPYRYNEKEKFAGLTQDEKDAMLESEREACLTVVDALKADGFVFASHSYGHGNMTTNSVQKYCSDMDRWFKEVGILVGETDIFVYPYGADICDWRGYSGEKYEYAIANGFHFFCNVDSAQYWVQMKADYLRQGRINFDGERMMKTPELVEAFFHAEDILDPSRPYQITE